MLKIGIFAKCSYPEPSRHLRWLRVHAELTVSATAWLKSSQKTGVSIYPPLEYYKYIIFFYRRLIIIKKYNYCSRRFWSQSDRNRECRGARAAPKGREGAIRTRKRHKIYLCKQILFCSLGQ